MKSAFKVLLLLTSFTLVAFNASAQNLFPRTFTVQWDPNPASDNVTHYIVSVNAVAIPEVSASTCSATVCQVNTTVAQPPANNTLTFSVIAVNANASSIPTSVTLIIAAPAQVKNMRVTSQGGNNPPK